MPRRRSRRRLIHDIPVIHRRDSKDSAWRDSEGRVSLNLRRPGRAGRKRTEPLDGGLRETRRRSARIEADDAAERAKQKKKREAQAEPTFFEIVRRKTGAFGPTEPRRGIRWSLLRRKPSPDMRRDSNVSMDIRLGNRKKSSDFGRNPRDRPGPKGLGRNLSRDNPSPHRRGIWIRAKWGPAATPAPITVLGFSHPGTCGCGPALAGRTAGVAG